MVPLNFIDEEAEPMRNSLVHMRNLGLGGVPSLTRGGRPRSPPLSVAGVLSAALGCCLLCCAGLHVWLQRLLDAVFCAVLASMCGCSSSRMLCSVVH